MILMETLNICGHIEDHIKSRLIIIEHGTKIRLNIIRQNIMGNLIYLSHQIKETTCIHFK